MQEVVPLAPVEKRRVSPLILIVGGTLAVSFLFLLLPSSRTSRTNRAKEKLKNEYAGPKDLSYLQAGTFVADDGFSRDKARGGNGRMGIFAPRPTDTIPPDFFDGMRPYRYMGTAEASGWHCLLAPDSSSTGWSLFAKVWIAESLQKHTKSTQEMDTLAREMLASSSSGITKLKAIWLKVPAKIQAEAESILAKNREVVKELPGIHQYYQASGVNYEIKSTHSIWEFDQLLEDAEPKRGSD